MDVTLVLGSMRGEGRLKRGKSRKTRENGHPRLYGDLSVNNLGAYRTTLVGGTKEVNKRIEGQPRGRHIGYREIFHV